MKIDFVVSWVNGNDPAWQALRNQYSGEDAPIDESRYRDWDILKYWFRAVEKYAPWVNKVHFVTCGQWPQWLNKENPRLNMVDHKDFIPAAYLPTFNSMCIGLNLHLIEGLAEHFVYFNDDVFVNAPVKEEDFFVDSLPCNAAVMSTLAPGKVNDPHIHAICNVMALVNTHFSKKAVLKKDPAKWYSFKYGKGLIKNLLNTPGAAFSNFSNPHAAFSLRKSTFETVWDLEREALDASCMNKFRGLNGVNQYIMGYFDICRGEFAPRKPSFSKCYDIGIRSGGMHDDIRTGRHKVICVNDHESIADFEGEKAKLIAAFEATLPDKCSFER